MNSPLQFVDSNGNVWPYEGERLRVILVFLPTPSVLPEEIVNRYGAGITSGRKRIAKLLAESVPVYVRTSQHGHVAGREGNVWVRVRLLESTAQEGTSKS